MTERARRTASAQGRASCEKGKRFEREITRFFKEHGISARRTAQFCGKTGQAGDVEGVPSVHIECKFVEKLNLEAAYAQSVRDAEAAGKGEIPVVIHKKSRKPAMITLALEDWICMYLAWQNSQEKTKEGEINYGSNSIFKKRLLPVQSHLCCAQTDESRTVRY